VKAPRRLLEENELFAKLVDDARRREPPPGALESLLDVVESPVDAASAQARARLGVRLSAPWLWFAIAGASGLALVSFVATEGRHDPTRGAETAIPAVEPPAAPAIAQPAGDDVPSIAIEDLPDSKQAAPRSSRRTGPAPPSPPPSPSAKPSAPREIELIARAREELTKGDAEACLATIAIHDAQFPKGQFTPEAQVMRIEATKARGDRAGARTLARAFLSDYPESPSAGRIRSLLARMERE
jgi:Outer membrane lipoprotein